VFCVCACVRVCVLGVLCVVCVRGRQLFTRLGSFVYTCILFLYIHGSFAFIKSSMSDCNLCCRELPCCVVCCSVLQGVAGCCRMLQGVAVLCSVLQHVSVCCSVLQCVAACCSVLQRGPCATAFKCV